MGKINPEHFRNHKAGEVVQVVEFLSKKCEPLSSISSTTKSSKPEIMMKHMLHITVKIFLMRKRKHHNKWIEIFEFMSTMAQFAR
jgi:hypothetical protein